MDKHKADFSIVSADSEALFMGDGLGLKDGRPTPYFFNMGSAADKASIRNEIGKAYAGLIKGKMDEGMDIDIVFGPSYKASLIAGDATLVLLRDHGIDLGCCYDRKEAKTHGEASVVKDLFVGAKFFDGANVYMVDDVGTSMETKREGLEKIAAQANASNIQVNVVGIGLGVDREQVGPVYDESKSADLPNKERVILGERGEDAIGDFVAKTGIPVDSVIGIREMMQFLYETEHYVKIRGEKQPIDDKTYEEFQQYMKTYGVER